VLVKINRVYLAMGGQLRCCLPALTIFSSEKDLGAAPGPRLPRGRCGTGTGFAVTFFTVMGRRKVLLSPPLALVFMALFASLPRRAALGKSAPV